MHPLESLLANQPLEQIIQPQNLRFFLPPCCQSNTTTLFRILLKDHSFNLNQWSYLIQINDHIVRILFHKGNYHMGSTVNFGRKNRDGQYAELYQALIFFLNLVHGHQQLSSFFPLAVRSGIVNLFLLLSFKPKLRCLIASQ